MRIRIRLTWVRRILCRTVSLFITTSGLGSDGGTGGRQGWRAQYVLYLSGPAAYLHSIAYINHRRDCPPTGIIWRLRDSVIQFSGIPRNQDRLSSIQKYDRTNR